MQKRTLAAVTAVGLTAAIAIPTIAFGNARSNEGTLSFIQAAQTPLTALMNGPADLTASTPTGDPNGTGTAAFTFAVVDPSPTGAQVCWDLNYLIPKGIPAVPDTPIAAHIHRGGPGVAGPIVVPAGGVSFPNLGPTSATGCMTMDGTLAQEIVGNPSGFYVNVHTNAFPAGAIRDQLAAGPPPSGESHLLAQPLRAYDSRTADGPLGVNATRSVSLAAGLDGSGAAHVAVPAGSTGAIVTLTVTNTGTGVGGAGGFLKLYSAALATPPSISSINWSGGGQSLAVTTQVAVDPTGRVNVFAGANATDFVIDVIGFVF
jgi:hypothetical protein